MLHHIVIAVYQDFELLDATGPASVFASANHALAEDGEPGRYAVHLASPTGGAVPSSSGVVVETKALAKVPRGVDTILVAGAEAGAVTAATRTPELGRWLSRSASSVRRLGSVCAGSFVLAAAGLVDGKRVPHTGAPAKRSRDSIPPLRSTPMLSMSSTATSGHRRE
ncbi:DJ-1/PfpI family protein [Sinorhizobium meliloti]|uniref:DJ-1/PfpI family protein n=1 Tax=Rhizobium meliloti TaxID=382 RepID=UPI001F217973|nr:DJ-1/PfpI family protein [Sinorhizobium meliloti]